ncbi:MAG: class I SAM-dependent methyltransferase [Deltaproteobacteria bacterium]|nr:class I SAM-dependent methyltransferase [Deltaproteobacteria bacterium]
MRPFFPRVRGGSRDAAAVLDDLVEYHRSNPGVTEATLGALTTRDGRTGYDLLAERVAAGAQAVLDLGCGNGPLLERLLTLPLARVVGVDLCAAELALARARCGDDPRLELLEASGHAFDVRDLDAVVSHHAFYLMEPIEAVIANVARALRPGGTFAWITSSPRAAEHPVFAALMTRFAAITRREHPTFGGWGDRRVWSEEGLRSLFSPELFTPFSIDDFVLVAREPSEALADRLLRFFYSAELQSDEGRAETRRAWLEVLDGRDRVELPWAMVTMRRR